jgi:hypothetical protein
VKIITVASILIFFPSLAFAQTGFFFVPSVTVSRVNDDNIFFTSDDKETDQITRISPALEAGYESARLSWDTVLSQDSEDYKDNSQLDSNRIRRAVNLNAQYLATPRMTLNGRAAWLKTETPSDIDIISGLPQGRFNAESYLIEPTLEYRFSAASTGSLIYQFEDIKIPELASSDAHTAGLRFEHSLSSENVLTTGYFYRRYQFNNEESAESHTPWVGFIHNFTTSTRIETELGPRFGNDGTDAYLLLSLIRTYDHGLLELSYTIDESTSIGDIGIIENRTAGLALAHQQGENIVLSISGNAGKIIYFGLTSDVVQANLGISYRLMDALFLSASYAYNEQRSGFLETTDREISRSTFAVGFRLTWPSRSSSSRNAAN